jgi:hypothetical protein
LEEIIAFLSVIHDKKVVLSMIQKSKPEETFFTSKEGYDALKMLQKIKDSISKSKVMIVSSPEKENRINKVYEVFKKCEAHQITMQEAADELGVEKVTYYFYAQQLRA